MRSLGLGYKLCADSAVIPVAGQRTHGTTFRALEVTSLVATPGLSLRSVTALLLRWLLEWERRPTTTRPGSGAGLVAIARADWLQGHAMETAKMRRVRRRRDSKEGSREVYEKEEM